MPSTSIGGKFGILQVPTSFDDEKTKEIYRLKTQVLEADEKVRKLETVTNKLRKQYLKELILVKEAQNQGP
jgi:hypothetical protein